MDFKNNENLRHRVSVLLQQVPPLLLSAERSDALGLDLVQQESSLRMQAIRLLADASKLNVNHRATATKIGMELLTLANDIKTSTIPLEQKCGDKKRDVAHYKQKTAKDLLTAQTAWHVLQGSFGALQHGTSFFGGNIVAKRCGRNNNTMFRVIAFAVNVATNFIFDYTFLDVLEHLSQVIANDSARSVSEKISFLVDMYVEHRRLKIYPNQDTSMWFKAKTYDHRKMSSLLRMAVKQATAANVRLADQEIWDIMAHEYNNLDDELDFTQAFGNLCKYLAASFEYDCMISEGTLFMLGLLVKHPFYVERGYGFIVVDNGIITSNPIIKRLLTGLSEAEMHTKLCVAFIFFDSYSYQILAYCPPTTEATALHVWFDKLEHKIPKPLYGYLLAQSSTTDVATQLALVLTDATLIYRSIEPSQHQQSSVWYSTHIDAASNATLPPSYSTHVDAASSAALPPSYSTQLQSVCPTTNTLDADTSM